MYNFFFWRRSVVVHAVSSPIAPVEVVKRTDSPGATSVARQFRQIVADLKKPHSDTQPGVIIIVRIIGPYQLPQEHVEIKVYVWN